MELHEKNAATTAGHLAALNVLVAKALAIASLGRKDPRGDLREVLSAIEETLGEANLDVPPESSDVALGAARETVMSVGNLADLMLETMGAPPADGGQD